MMEIEDYEVQTAKKNDEIYRTLTNNLGRGIISIMDTIV